MFRFAGLAFAGVMAVVIPASAAPDFPLSTLFSGVTNTPAGWSRNMDGSYKQNESGVLCPQTFNGYTFVKLDGPDDKNPNILGTCHYTDGSGRDGSIRIRRYIEGWGSTMSIANNDKALMSGNAPPMMMRASVDRNGGGRATVTVVRNGLLVDCSVWQAEHNAPQGSFPLYCTTIPGS
jgi:hypothetical protein